MVPHHKLRLKFGHISSIAASLDKQSLPCITVSNSASERMIKPHLKSRKAIPALTAQSCSSDGDSDQPAGCLSKLDVHGVSAKPGRSLLSPIKLSLPSFRQNAKRNMEEMQSGSSKRIRLIVNPQSSQEPLLPHKKRRKDPVMSVKKQIKFRVVSKSFHASEVPMAEPLDNGKAQTDKVPKDSKMDNDDDEVNKRARSKVFDYLKWAVRSQSEVLRCFDVKGLLGWGGCGFVLQATEKSSMQEVAVKVIYRTKNMALSPAGIPPEIEIMKALRHPNLTNYLSHFSDVRAFYLVMERRGTPWRLQDSATEIMNEWLQSRITAMGSFSPNSPISFSLLSQDRSSEAPNASSSLFDYLDQFGTVASHLIPRFFIQVATGLAYLHGQSVFHGDLKEENILIELNPKTGTYHLYLCDFGHSRKARSGDRLMRFYGTRDVSSPELVNNLLRSDASQVHDKKWFDGYSQDIWALGLVLYTMIFGALPENMNELLDGTLNVSQASYFPTEYRTTKVSRECINLLQSMLSIDLEERPTIEQVLAHPFCQKTIAT